MASIADLFKLRPAAPAVARGRIENFAVIVGAMKSGTTTLYKHLVTHPQMAGCRVKEPNFFSDPSRFAEGPESYRALWPDFDPARHRWALEASPGYAKRPRYAAALERMRDFDGRLRLFYVLRDPIERIESQIAHNIAKGRTTPETYMRALPQALDVSRYAFQIDGFAATLGITPLLLDFDELRRDPRRTLARCVAHLEIDPGFAFEIQPPSNVRATRNDAQDFRLDAVVRARLRAALRPDVLRLRDVYGFDVSAWNFDAEPLETPEAAVATLQHMAWPKGRRKARAAQAARAAETDPAPAVAAQAAQATVAAQAAQAVVAAQAAVAPPPTPLPAAPVPAPAVAPTAANRAAAQSSRPAKAAGASLASEPDPTQGARGGYWLRRGEMMYYRYVLEIAGRLAQDATSLIDVGSHTTSIAEKFDWIPDRVALDLRQPYSSAQVRGVQADFLRYEPETRFDFALCLQVLEHVPPAGDFAKKLLRVADRVLVSVPYKWPKGACRHHCQDPVDEDKLAGWFGRRPDYSIVVEEPLNPKSKGRRLIAYFHTPGAPLVLRPPKGAKGKAKPKAAA